MSEIEEMLEVLARPRFDWLQIEVAGVCNAACAYCALTCYKREREGGLIRARHTLSKTIHGRALKTG